MCMMLHGDHSRKTIQEHHVIYGTANRRLSEKYGLKVYLCLYHHEEGPEAVHKNAKMSLILKIQAQRAFQKKFPALDWMKIFGKNYDIEGREREPARWQQASTPGFMMLSQEEGVENDEIFKSI